MAVSDHGPASHHDLVAVYEDQVTVDRVRAELVDAGVPDSAISLNERADEIASLRGEMHEELTNAWIVPNAAFAATKEGMKGILIVGTIASLVGLAICLPFAFIDFGPALPVRLVIFASLGLGFGGTVGLIAGAATGARRPGELSAAHRGIVVRVRADDESIRDVLVRHEPIRLDEVMSDGTPVDTITTEGDRSDAPSAAEEMVLTAATTDDYSPPDPTHEEIAEPSVTANEAVAIDQHADSS